MSPEESSTAIRNLRIPHAASEAAPHVTISLGVACLTASGEDPRILIQLADEALYEAKKSGRDRMILQDPDPTPGAIGTR